MSTKHSVQPAGTPCRINDSNQPEDGVDVRAGRCDPREEDVEVVGPPEGRVRQLPQLDEPAEAGEEREGQEGELGTGVDPEHLLGELGGVLKCWITFAYDFSTQGHLQCLLSTFGINYSVTHLVVPAVLLTDF